MQVILMTIPLATYKPEFAPFIPIWEERNKVGCRQQHTLC
jgi:hypothetical protein